MTSPARRSVAVGAELDRLNGLRARRAQAMRSRWFADCPPSARAVYLLDIAELDARRRALRELLADQLSAYSAEAAVPPRSDPWTGGPRHARA